MNWKPNKWIAGVLGLLAQPLGLLYVARPGWAVVYLLILCAVGYLKLAFPPGAAPNLIPDMVGAVVAVLAAAHAWYIAKHAEARTLRPGYTRWYGLAGFVTGFLALIFLVRVFVAEPFRVPGESMLPLYPAGSILVVNKWGYGHYGNYGVTLLRTKISVPLLRADVIVFDYPQDPQRTYVKRLIGLPGDSVVYRDKRLTINGVAVPTAVLEKDGVPVSMPSRSRQLLETLGASPYAVLVDDYLPSISLAGVRSFPGREKCAYDESGFKCNIPADNYFVMGDHRDNSEDSRYWGFVPESAIIGKVVHVFMAK
jgi:signal peptidase I